MATAGEVRVEDGSRERTLDQLTHVINEQPTFERDIAMGGKATTETR